MGVRSCNSAGTGVCGLGLAQFGAFHVRDFVVPFFVLLKWGSRTPRSRFTKLLGWLSTS
jgi:hypothetical protein